MTITLKELLKRSEITVTEFAKAIGVSNQSAAAYVNRKTRFPKRKLQTLCEVFGCTQNDLFDKIEEFKLLEPYYTGRVKRKTPEELKTAVQGVMAKIDIPPRNKTITERAQSFFS